MSKTAQSSRLCTIISTTASVVAGLLLLIGFALRGTWGGVAWMVMIVAGREFGRYYPVFFRSTKTLIANTAFIVLILLVPIGLILELHPALLFGALLANFIAWDGAALQLRMNEVTNSADSRHMLRRHYLILFAVLIISTLCFVGVGRISLTFSVWISIAIAAVAVLALLLIARNLIKTLFTPS